MVPVLSTHRTSTLASVSIHFISCTSTLSAASLMVLTANARLDSRYSPSGIIPITAAAIPVILSFKFLPILTKDWVNTIIPIGIIIIPIIIISLLRARIISDCSFLWVLVASMVSFEAKASAPTFSSFAFRLPDTT